MLTPTTFPSDAEIAAYAGVPLPTSSASASAPSSPAPAAPGFPSDADMHNYAFPGAPPVPAPSYLADELTDLGAPQGFGKGVDRFLNGAAADFYPVPQHISNGLVWLADKTGIGPAINRLTGQPIVPTYAQQVANTGDLESGLTKMPQSGVAGTAGHIFGGVTATLPLMDGALGLVGRGADALTPIVERFAPGAGNVVRGVGNWLTGEGGVGNPGLGGVGARTLSRGAQGAIMAGAAAAGTGAPIARTALLGAALGGGAPAVGTVLDKAGTVGRNMLAPVADLAGGAATTAAQRIYAALTADGTTPEEALGVMRSLGPHGMLADTGGANVRGISEAVANSPGEGSNIAQKTLQNRMDEQPVRVRAAVRSATGADAGIHAQADQLMADRAAASRPLYTKALNQTVPLDPRLGEFLKTPELASALKSGIATAQRNAIASGEPFNPRDYLAPAVPGSEVPSAILDAQGRPLATTQIPATSGQVHMRVLDAAKQGLDDAVERYRDPTSGKLVLDGEGRSLNNLRAAFVNHLDSINPDYSAARAAYAGPSQSLDAMNMGRATLGKDAEVTQDIVKRLAPGDKAFFRSGLTRALQDKIDSTPDGASAVRRIFNNSLIRSKIAAAFDDPAAFAKFKQQMESEATFADTRNQVLAGSQTARRLAAQDAQNFDFGTHAAKAVTGRVGEAVSGIAKGAYNKLMVPSRAQLTEQARILFSQDPDYVQNALMQGTPSPYDEVLKAGQRYAPAAAVVGRRK